jgi:uncharacterized membrane protein
MKIGIFFGQISSPERLRALTDGIYAIVATLLVLDLKIPETPGLTNTTLTADLFDQIPNFIAYLISFAVVAGLWMRNHWILEPLKKCNETTFWLNLLHLLFLTLIPFTASLIGHYEQDAIAVILFSGSLGLPGCSLLLIHRYVIPKTDWHGETTSRAWTSPNWLLDYPAPIFAMGSILLAFVSIPAALGLWFLLPVWVLLFLHHRQP